ncbi:hypothetical protein ANABIO32_29960 [Rossellomorea marisflavi]|nr:hypothetical protein ANABIO32_29960 [Rossellomorea marisflavi]
MLRFSHKGSVVESEKKQQEIQEKKDRPHEDEPVVPFSVLIVFPARDETGFRADRPR